MTLFQIEHQIEKFNEFESKSTLFRWCLSSLSFWVHLQLHILETYRVGTQNFGLYPFAQYSHHKLRLDEIQQQYACINKKGKQGDQLFKWLACKYVSNMVIV